MNYCYLESVMTRAKLPEDSVKDLLATAKALPEELVAAMEAALALYQKDTDFDFKGELERIAELAPEDQKYAAQLIFSFMLTEHTETLYKERGLSDELFDNMLSDLRVKNEECLRYHGKNGSFVASWFYRWFSMQRFAFERLQFEVRPLGVSYRHLTPESLAINVHIPSTGPLDHEACLRDYARAAKFFAADFGEQDIAFMCHSWLLHPEHPKFLPATSRLLAFQADFDIVRFDEDPECRDLWRLFGTRYDGNPQNLTERNSLERAYKQHLLSGGKVGEGLGVFLYNK